MKVWGIALLAGAVLAAGCDAASASPVNLLANGSFENGFAGWTVAGTGTPYGTPLIITTNGSTAGPYGDIVPADNVSQSPDAVGTHAAYFVDDAATESLTQSVSVIAGTTYQVGFDYFVTQSGANNLYPFTLSVALGPEIFTMDTTIDPVVAGSWAHFSDSFTAGASGSAIFTFAYNSGPQPAKDVIVDEVYATAVPEPLTLSLFGAGLAGLAFFRRRRAGKTR